MQVAHENCMTFYTYLIDIFLFYSWTNVRHKARKTIIKGWVQLGPQSPGWVVQRLINANPGLGTV